MKLPIALGKLAAVKGVFARLNPADLFAKVKAKLPLKKGKKASQDELDKDDFLPSSAEGGDMFAGLGDLDALDAAAAARQQDEQKAQDAQDAQDALDFENERPTETPEHLDDMAAGGELPPNADFPDLDVEEGAGGEGRIKAELSALEDMPDFEDDEALAEQEELKAKKKKLLMLAGGGVAAAVLIGAASWLMLGESAPGPQVEAASGVVISLENIPLAGSRNAPQSAVPKPAAAPLPEEGVLTSVDTATTEAERTLAQLGLAGSPEPGVGMVVPAVTPASFATVPAAAPGTPLRVAPVDILVEQSDFGLLPRIAEDGLTAYDAYARPEPQNLDDAKPKVGLIVTGLGMSRAATEAAIAAMPEDVTLSLDAYARGLDFWVARARDDGHEVLLSLPLEAENFPFEDPGPDALKVLDSPEDNVRKLEYVLGRTTGYLGVLAVHGSKFLTVEDQVDNLIAQLKNRGLMYVDGGAEGSLGTRSAYKVDVPWATVEIDFDRAQSAAEFQNLLGEFEALARKRALSIARVSATPLSMARLQAWLATLDDKGFQLVPVSALAKKQLIR